MIDVGLDYMKKLGVKPARSFNNVISNFQSNAGKQKADVLARLLSARGTQQNCSENLYDLKNINLQTALTFNCNVDGDIIRKVCNWVYQHKNDFGKRILEVGCDIGVLSCFLAELFPESHITAIDINSSGIAIAKQLAEKFNIKNVTFLVQDIKEVTDSFDTVFSCRTMHENYSCIEDPFLMLNDYAALFRASTSPYAQALRTAVAPNGNLISIERCERNPLFLGWLYALMDNGLYLLADTHEELECNEVGDKNYFQAIVADSVSTMDAEQIYNVYCNTYAAEAQNASFYQGWIVPVLLQNSVSKPIVKYEVLDTAGKKMMQYALWELQDDDASIIYHLYNGTYEMSVHDTKCKSELLAQLEEHSRSFENQGYRVITERT